MKLTLIKFSLFVFSLIFIKKIVFPEWEFKKVDFNSIELLLLIFTLGFLFYYWIKVAKNKTLVKRISVLSSLLICTIILCQNFTISPDIIRRIVVNDEEEIHIRPKDPSYCLGDLDYCMDSIKVTKYKIFQKKEIM
ncbi:hypothetical protein [Faecalibacter rhinopitheci]|uniref:Uncharacterized protein n=1 Tax=Faecalibacter rhinopitheci TaxID=2779678 RepID=A0A8J7FPQ7_9FLAO|nr:hypothetical protein [Faecalibacter rhinopitheci]MBF0597510.1 hypothetical protein [Faecalibacter rhinopitheci]MBQ0148055.1 hypothetical protein [Candidatus Onthonaster equi]